MGQLSMAPEAIQVYYACLQNVSRDVISDIWFGLFSHKLSTQYLEAITIRYLEVLVKDKTLVLNLFGNSEVKYLIT